MKSLFIFDNDEFRLTWKSCMLDEEKYFYPIRKKTTITYEKYLDKDLHSTVRYETVFRNDMFITSRISRTIEDNINEQTA